MRVLLNIGLVVLSFVFATTLFASSAQADGSTGENIDWGDSCVDSSGWQRIEGASYWGNVPASVPDDPYQYDFKFVCQTSGDDFATVCLANAASKCTEAAHGQLVNWYRSLKFSSAPVWSFLSGPTCIYSEKPRDILAEIAAGIEHEFQNSPVAPATVG
ncbi:hypothetical protein IV500_21125, partial [Paeniglutamicibacter antarcticus]|nr:hypothetical protein [Arthrobacter terrae]